MFIVSTISFLILKKVHLLNVLAKREKVYTQNKITTRDTTFTDHFCPLANVAKVPNTSFLTAQITAEMAGSQSSIVLEYQPQHSESTSNLNTTSPQLNNKMRSFEKQRVSPIERFYKTVFPILYEFVFMCLLFACSSMWPSAMSAPYFIVFIILLTKWSITRLSAQDKLDSVIKIALIFYLPLHILVYFLYQLDFFQFYLTPDTLIARLMGFNQVLFTRCEQPGHFYFSSNVKWQQITYPFILFTLYWFLAVQFSHNRERTSFFEVTPSTQPATTVPSIVIIRSPTFNRVKF